MIVPLPIPHNVDKGQLVSSLLRFFYLRLGDFCDDIVSTGTAFGVDRGNLFQRAGRALTRSGQPLPCTAPPRQPPLHPPA